MIPKWRPPLVSEGPQSQSSCLQASLLLGFCFCLFTVFHKESYLRESQPYQRCINKSILKMRKPKLRSLQHGDLTQSLTTPKPVLCPLPCHLSSQAHGDRHWEGHAHPGCPQAVQTLMKSFQEELKPKVTTPNFPELSFSPFLTFTLAKLLMILYSCFKKFPHSRLLALLLCLTAVTEYYFLAK